MAYLIALVIQIPIRQVLAWIEPLPEKIQVYGPQGTIFSAQAALIQKDELRFEQFSWKFRPELLFTGKIAGDVSFHNSDETRGAAQINYPIFGAPHLTNTRLRFPVKTIESYFSPMPINLNGWVSVELDYLAGIDKLNIVGQTRIENLIFTGTTTTPFGDFLIVWTTNPDAENNPGTILGKITDQNGPLQLNAEINIDHAGAWRFNGTIIPRENAPQEITQMLIFLGQPDPEGKYSVSWDGQLPKMNKLLPNK